VAQVYKKDLVDRVAMFRDAVPRDVVRLAVDLTLEAMADGLAEGREVCLRGFGRFIPRRYEKAKNKKIGLLFHASPRLKSKIPDEN
jgi:nucleoid DNA-binding protein